MAFGGLLATLRKQVTHLPLGFTEPHIEDFRPFETEEKLGTILAGLLADLQPQIMRGSFAEEGFAATGWAVQQEAFRHRMAKAPEQGGVQKRQFDRIADSLHRFLLAANGAPKNRLDAGKGPVQAFG